MKTIGKLNSPLLATGFAGVIILLAVGCSSDKDNTNATPGVTGGVASTSTGGSAATDTGGSAATDGGATSTGGSTSAGGATGTGGGACVPDTSESCYSCPPTNNEQILTACSDATCVPFDNAARNVPATLTAIP